MTTIANELLQQESATESCQTPQSSAISEHSSVRGTPIAILEWLTLYRQDFPANRSALQARGPEKTTPETNGPKQLMSFAEYDHDSRCWRTYQACLLTNTREKYSGTRPKAGMTVSGAAYPLRKQEHRISEIGGGLWPTPAARDYRSQHADRSESFLSRQKHPRGVNLVEELQRRGFLGRLNPMWVEWLMGWPLGWTDLRPLEMDRFQQWCEQHGGCCHKQADGE
jgi:hypothetical protein